MKKITTILALFIFSTAFAPNLDKEFRKEISTEQTRIILLNETKHLVLTALSDVERFTIDRINSIDEDHLLFMENQRQYYNIPFHIYYRLIFKESSYTQTAISHVGATGYMQIMPATFAWIFGEFNLDILCIEDPYDNIRTGAFFLRHLKDLINQRYPNDTEEFKWKRVLASYNAGFGRHLRAMYRFPETIDYVDFIMNKNPVQPYPIIDYDNYLHNRWYI